MQIHGRPGEPIRVLCHAAAAGTSGLYQNCCRRSHSSSASQSTNLSSLNDTQSLCDSRLFRQLLHCYVVLDRFPKCEDMAFVPLAKHPAEEETARSKPAGPAALRGRTRADRPKLNILPKNPPHSGQTTMRAVMRSRLPRLFMYLQLALHPIYVLVVSTATGSTKHQQSLQTWKTLESSPSSTDS